MSLPDTLLKAYRETHYHVNSDPSFILHPGVYCAELAQLHSQFQVTSSAVITAWNPYSKMLSEEVNSQRHRQLCDAVSSMDLRPLSAIGQHPSGNWPGEESLFILGIELSEASELGKRFDQNAIVYSPVDAVPTIVMLV